MDTCIDEAETGYDGNVEADACMQCTCTCFDGSKLIHVHVCNCTCIIMCDKMSPPQTHSGSVWRVTWAHPEYGQVLATCSFDRTVCIWEEQGEVNYMYNV